MSVARRITRRRKKRDAAALFEEEFAFESLKSDRLRVTILIGAIISALFIVLILVSFFFGEFQTAFHGNFRSFLLAVFIIFSANLTYLLVERAAIDRLIRKRQKPFAALKYFSADDGNGEIWREIMPVVIEREEIEFGNQSVGCIARDQIDSFFSQREIGQRDIHGAGRVGKM